jgi:hypothetical protein
MNHPHCSIGGQGSHLGVQLFARSRMSKCIFIATAAPSSRNVQETKCTSQEQRSLEVTLQF